MLYSTLCCQNHKAKSLLSRVGVWLWEDVNGSLAISKWDSLRLLLCLESCYSMESALKIIKGLQLYPQLWFTTNLFVLEPLFACTVCVCELHVQMCIGQKVWSLSLDFSTVDCFETTQCSTLTWFCGFLLKSNVYTSHMRVWSRAA